MTITPAVLIIDLYLRNIGSSDLEATKPIMRIIIPTTITVIILNLLFVTWKLQGIYKDSENNVRIMFLAYFPGSYQ
jgi:hypothetical protein